MRFFERKKNHAPVLPNVYYCTEIFNSAGGVTCDPFAGRYFSAGLVATCDTPKKSHFRSPLPHLDV
jgi:hypothetical protein